MWFQFANDTPPSADNPNPISNLFYGFPSVPWGPPNLARIAVDAVLPTRVIKDPNERTPDIIEPTDLEITTQFVANHIVGTGLRPIPVFSSQCLQTNVSDNMFVLDWVPDNLLPPDAGSARSKSVAVFTAGWGMKFVPMIGLIMKQLLIDGEVTKYDISHFEIGRNGPDGQPIVQQGEMKTRARHTAVPSGSGCR